ncbi:hypothetical protein D3C77_535870 [compost metagenome]
MSFIACHKIGVFNRAYRIFAVHCNRETLVIVQRRHIQIIGLKAIVKSKLQRYHYPIDLPLLLQGIHGSLELPFLVEHAEHTSTGQLRQILLIVRDEGFLVDHTLVVHFVQLCIVAFRYIFIRLVEGELIVDGID